MHELPCCVNGCSTVIVAAVNSRTALDKQLACLQQASNGTLMQRALLVGLGNVVDVCSGLDQLDGRGFVTGIAGLVQLRSELSIRPPVGP